MPSRTDNSPLARLLTDFHGKHVLVTGASTGIGAATAEAFGQAGAQVAVHYNSSKVAAEKVVERIKAAGGTASCVQGDFAVSTEVRRVVHAAAESMGGLDILINNAGAMVRRAALDEITDDLFDEIVNLNARSVVMACAEAVPIIKEAGGGAIVNVSSLAARNGGAKGSLIYAASKGFVSTFTKGLAREVAPHGIRVNAIAPGIVLTPFQERYSTPAGIEASIASIPLRRAAVTEDCVPTILYLASPSLSGFITGQSVEVNGGVLMI